LIDLPYLVEEWVANAVLPEAELSQERLMTLGEAGLVFRGNNMAVFLAKTS
jgi:hypothetical protein